MAERKGIFKKVVHIPTYEGTIGLEVSPQGTKLHQIYPEFKRLKAWRNRPDYKNVMLLGSDGQLSYDAARSMPEDRFFVDAQPRVSERSYLQRTYSARSLRR